MDKKKEEQQGEPNNKEAREVWLDESALSEIASGEGTEEDDNTNVES